MFLKGRRSCRTSRMRRTTTIKAVMASINETARSMPVFALMNACISKGLDLPGKMNGVEVNPTTPFL
jgi:hypothetical protein